MAMNEARARVVTIVVNPSSGMGRAGRMLKKVTRVLTDTMPDAYVRVVRTHDYAHAREWAFRAVTESGSRDPGLRPDVLVMMGGDGMSALGINACAGSRVQLGIIPAGTGNDFARGVGVPDEPMHAAAVIAKGRTKRIDLMLAQGTIADGTRQRYVGSVVSSGYDSKVNRRVNQGRLNLGFASYGMAVLTEMAHLAPLNYRLTIDGVYREEPAVLVAVGNAGFIGAGINICPLADPTDGLLDITFVGPVSRRELIKVFPKLFNGTFVKHPAVECFRAKEVLLDGDSIIPMADGEHLGLAPLRLTCEPGAVEILVAEGTTYV